MPQRWSIGFHLKHALAQGTSALGDERTQSQAARWRIRVKPAASLHYAGAEAVCLLPAWVGDRVFAHAALRKSADELGILAPLFNDADIHSANLMILPPRLVLVTHTVLRIAPLLCAPMFGWTS